MVGQTELLGLGSQARVPDQSPANNRSLHHDIVVTEVILKVKIFIGVAQTVFLVNRVFVPCQKGAVLTKTAKSDEVAFYPLKTRASLLRPPKTTKMTKMAGVTQEKAWV